MVASTGVFASPARAATVSVVGTVVDSAPACSTAVICFLNDGKPTASVSGSTVTAINPITAYEGDTISLTNQAGVHNMIFCKTGTTINGWNCGDPIAAGGPEPGAPAVSGAGAPTKIGEGAASFQTTLDTAGTYFFWCGIGSHRIAGQYGKLEVLSGQRPAGTPTTSVASTTTVASTVATAPTTAVVAAPTLTVKKAAGRVTASGKTTAGARVSLQKLVGKKWVTVASTKASASGSYSVRAKAESKRTTYRVLVGSRSSTSRSV